MAKRKRQQQQPVTETVEELLQEVQALWPAARGSVSEVRKPCVNPNCRVCASGEKHPVWLYSCVLNGKRKCVYVPRDQVAALQKALANGKALEQVLVKAGLALIREGKEKTSD